MKRPSISLACIMKNEAHNLPILLGSVKDCFDEILITDTGSTDDSVEVAKKLGAQVTHFEWCHDFAKARNASFEPVKTDYVMWLDLDDSLQNREAFIEWRDNAMEFADYWLATYHYAYDANDKPVCSFVRERVLNTAFKFNWRYFIHEGVIPASNYYRQPRISKNDIWSVRHRRSPSDLQQDRGRNLKIFEHNKDRLDARMKYYYGKELFENDKPLDGIRFLTDAQADPDLQGHDRVLCIQYSCYAAMAMNQFNTAIHFAYLGLEFEPNRAEFYNIIADCQMKMGKVIEAIPAYNAAKNCIMPQNVGPIFLQSHAYTTHPREMLAKIYGNIGNIDRSIAEAEEAASMGSVHAANEILPPLRKAKQFSYMRPAGEKTNGDIVISCPHPGPWEWDGKLYREKPLGGSETAAVEMAERLSRLTGRKTIVFNHRQKEITHAGVEYRPANLMADYFMNETPEVHIAWRHNIKLTNARTYLWQHDLMTTGAENTAVYEKAFCLSPFHARYVHSMQGVPFDKIWVTKNGIDSKRFTSPLPVKDPFKVVFASSPDRGLDRAIRIMDRFVEKYPKLTLEIFYGRENLRKYGLGQLADQLDRMIAARPWCIDRGFTEQNKMIETFKRSAIWLHPCDFIETFCLTSLETTLSGMYAVTRRLGGLQDTLKPFEEAGWATLLDHDCVTEEEYTAYAKAFESALLERKWEKPVLDPKQFDWDEVAKSWVEYLRL